MRNWGLPWAIAAAIVTLASATLRAQTAGEQTVTVLDPGEPFEGLAAIDGMLVVGSSRKEFAPSYKVEIYGSKHELLSTIPLQHSVAFIYKYANNTALIVGNTTEYTAYTVVKLNDGRNPQVVTHRIAESAWAFRWMGRIGERNYFSDPGGNSEDPERDTNHNLASQTIFTIVDGEPQYLRSRIRMPISGVAVGGGLFIIEGMSIQSSRDRMVYVGPNAAQATPILADPPADLRELVLLGDQRSLALSDEAKQSVLIVDAPSRQTLASVGVGPRPYSVAAAGRCAVVGDISDRTIRVINAADPRNPVVSYVGAVKSPDVEFRMLMKVTADIDAGIVYARSNVGCNPMAEVCPAGINRVIAVSNPELKKALADCKMP